MQQQQMAMQAQQQQPAYDRNDPEIRRAMIEAFSQQSKMKPKWAQKYLEDINWDFEVSFNMLKRFYHYV
jgi:predicted transcriptional regulator